MLNVALVGLLAGSLAIGTPDTGDEKKNPEADKQAAAEAAAPEAGPSVFGTPEVLTEAGVRTITADTYAYGRSSELSPIKFWVEYGWGQTRDDFYNVRGEATGFPAGEITSQRVTGGAQINFLNFSNIAVGVGGELTAAKNATQNPSAAVAVPGVGTVTADFADSDFGLQGAKVYATARGRVAGVHGGYIFDLGEDTVRDFSAVPGGGNAAISLGTSDDRNALTFGGSFDYPSERFRLFGGIDWYHLARENELEAGETDVEDDDLWNFVFGGGVKFNIVELGAALQIQTRLDNPTNDLFGTEGIGGHTGTVSPYLRISPPSLPASIFVKGAVQDEYTDYGFPIGGANAPRAKIGFTAGLTLGFE